MPQPSNPVALPLVPSIPWYRITTSIDGSPYILDVRWNARDVAWYFDILEIDETPIAYGLKIVLGALIGRRFNHSLFLNGAFAAFDLAGTGKDAGFDDLGVRVQLRYYTAYDIIAADRAASGIG